MTAEQRHVSVSTTQQGQGNIVESSIPFFNNHQKVYSKAEITKKYDLRCGLEKL